MFRDQRDLALTVSDSRAAVIFDEAVEAAPVPTLPTQDVLPKAVLVALSLMKPASPFA